MKGEKINLATMIKPIFISGLKNAFLMRLKKVFK